MCAYIWSYKFTLKRWRGTRDYYITPGRHYFCNSGNFETISAGIKVRRLRFNWSSPPSPSVPHRDHPFSHTRTPLCARACYMYIHIYQWRQVSVGQYRFARNKCARATTVFGLPRQISDNLYVLRRNKLFSHTLSITKTISIESLVCLMGHDRFWQKVIF